MTAGGSANRETSPPDDSVWPYVNLITRWRWPLIISMLVTGITVGVLVHLLPRHYLAQTSFIRSEPPAASSSSSGLSALTSQLGSGLPNLGAFGIDVGPSSSGGTSPAFYAALLESRGILHTVVTSTYTLSDGSHGSPVDLVAYFEIRAPTREEAEIRAMTRLRKRVLKVTSDRITGIISLEVNTTDPAVSAQIARRLLNLVSDFNQRRLQSQAGAEATFAETRAADALQNLRMAEDALAQFEERNRSIQQAPTLETERNRLQRRVNVAQQIYLSLAQRMESSKVEAVRNTPVLTVIDAPEGLVEPQPRHTVLFAAGGSVLAAILVLAYGSLVGRLPQIRTGAGYAEFRQLTRRRQRGGMAQPESAEPLA